MANINTAGVDPTKIGVGRAIAVLTSGGDAQGKQKVVICYGGLREGVQRNACMDN